MFCTQPRKRYNHLTKPLHNSKLQQQNKKKKFYYVNLNAARPARQLSLMKVFSNESDKRYERKQKKQKNERRRMSE